MRKAKLAQENKRYFCYITGAHFDYEDLCRRLERFRVVRIFSMKLAKQPKFTAKKKKLKKLPLGEKINDKKIQTKDNI